MIPGPKVGLIIGKGGETIKQLQVLADTHTLVPRDLNSLLLFCAGEIWHSNGSCSRRTTAGE